MLKSIKINSDKTKFTVFSPQGSSYNFINNPINIDGKILNQSGINNSDNTINFLGIKIDPHFTWKSHINYISKHISKGLYMINKLKNFLPVNILKTLYSTLVESYLTYGLSAWGNSVHISKLFKLQKRAVRIIDRKSYKYHTDPLFKSLNILKLPDLYNLQILLFMHDLLHNILPKSFQNFATLNVHLLARTTRQSNSFHTPLPRTKFSLKQPNHVFPRIWNNFNQTLSLNETRASLKKQYKSHIFSTYLNIVVCNNPSCIMCREI